MITLTQALDRAASKPFNEWTMEEMLAYEISKSNSEILRLRKKLRQAEEHNRNLQNQWYGLSIKEKD